MIRLVCSSESSPSCGLSSFMSWPVDYDPKDFKGLKLPKVPAKVLREIGRFMVMWGVVEGELDILVTAIYRLDPTFSLTITANLGTKAKIEMLRSAFDLLRDPLGSDFVRDADGLFVEVSDLSTGTRNVIAHGRMYDFDGQETRSFRFSARKRLEMTWYEIDPDFLKGQSDYAKELALALRQMIPHVVEVVRDLTPEEFDHFCVSR